MICNFPKVFCFKSVKKDTELFTDEMTYLEFVQQKKWGEGWEQLKHIGHNEFFQQLTRWHYDPVVSQSGTQEQPPGALVQVCEAVSSD